MFKVLDAATASHRQNRMHFIHAVDISSVHNACHLVTDYVDPGPSVTAVATGTRRRDV